MNTRLAEFGKYVVIAGFQDVKLEDVNQFFQVAKNNAGDACLQFFDASLIAGWEHLYFAALNALNAFKSRINVSNSVTMETLLYASAQRQIKEAVELIGIKPGTQHVAVLIMSKTQKQADRVLKTVSQFLRGRRDDSALALTGDKIDGIKRMFEISDAELEAKLQRKGLEKQALVDMVIEHMALLVTQR